MVPVGGVEPPRLSATDFESVVYTNFTTPAKTFELREALSEQFLASLAKAGHYS